MASGLQRRQYRVSPDLDGTVRCYAKLGEHPLFPIRLMDVSSGGAGLRYSGPMEESFVNGVSIILQFRSRFEDNLEVRGQVVHLRRVDGELFVGVKFNQWEKQRRSLAGEFRTLFNQRASYRVRPRPKEPVSVELGLQDGSSLRGALRDISITGIALHLHEIVDEPLAEQEVQLLFRFQDRSTLQLRATIVYVDQEWADDRGVTVLGAEYLRPSHAELRPIRDFVMQRQREELRTVNLMG